VRYTATSDKPTMVWLGSREQRAACYLFNERENILDRLNKSSMDDMRKNINLYNGYIWTLKFMLKKCESWLNEEELAEKLLYEPDFENISYGLELYEYDGRNYIYESEIKNLLAILSVKMEEYNRYLIELMVNAGVALALMWEPPVKTM
jgi:hypothetical protein